MQGLGREWDFPYFSLPPSTLGVASVVLVIFLSQNSDC